MQRHSLLHKKAYLTFLGNAIIKLALVAENYEIFGLFKPHTLIPIGASKVGIMVYLFKKIITVNQIPDYSLQKYRINSVILLY